MSFWIAFIVGFVVAILFQKFFISRDSSRSVNSKSQDSDNEVTKIRKSLQFPVKMVLGIRKDLKMGNGKKVAQGAHAAVGIVEKIIYNYQKDPKNPKHIKHMAYLKRWERDGVTKIAIKINNTESMEKVIEKAKEGDIPFYLVVDAGRTQIPSGSKTVIGIFGPSNIVDPITRQFKLL